ncbi:conserved hypothetical protein [Beggiatoa sp. PS]|nr:conserved hypothetical protein [Beggiatoa sp. PS]
MTALTIEQLYQQYIKPIPISEQFRLIALIGQQLAIQSASIDKKQRSLLELEGLGAEIWKDIDAQEYVDNLRQEWDKH